jgi:hypothetical protein
VALQLVIPAATTPREANVSSNDRAIAVSPRESVDVETAPAWPPALEYLVDRVMIALREYSPVPLRVVLEDALRDLDGTASCCAEPRHKATTAKSVPLALRGRVIGTRRRRRRADR